MLRDFLAAAGPRQNAAHKNRIMEKGFCYKYPEPEAEQERIHNQISLKYYLGREAEEKEEKEGVNRREGERQETEREP